MSYRTRFSRGFSYIVELRTNGKVIRTCNYIQTSLDIVTLTTHTKKKTTGELPTSLPMTCMWATEWAANGNFTMQIRLPTTSIYGNSGQLSGQLSRQPTASKYEKVDSSVSSGVGCPLAADGILPGKLVCPLLLYMKTVGSSVSSPLIPNVKKWAVQLAVEWAAHGNVAMQIRLPTTSMYGGSGQLSGQPTTFKYRNSG